MPETVWRGNESRVISTDALQDSDIDVRKLKQCGRRVVSGYHSAPSLMRKAVLAHRESEASPDSLLTSTSSILDDCVIRFLVRLVELQNRGLSEPKERFYKFKRYLCGFREVERALLRGTLVCVLCAVDVEPSDGDHGTTTAIQAIESESITRQIPFISGGTRKAFKKAIGCITRPSIIGVLKFDGAESEFASVQAARSSGVAST